jgi:hypothetical protein
VFQKLVSASAVVTGASTAGECAAPGMQTRRALSLTAISSWISGDQVLSSSP